MNHLKTLAFAAAVSLFASTAGAVVYILDPTQNNNGQTVAAQADITANGNLVTIVLSNLTTAMVASNQAISDLKLDFTTNVGTPTDFTQDGQLANVDANGNVTLVNGEPTRWDLTRPDSDTLYLNSLGGGQPDEMIGGLTYDPNGGLANFNPYLLGNGTFTFNLAGASLLRLSGVQFSFGTNHEFLGNGRCVSGCGGVINPNALVPEPATWGMMILGFGGIGAILRRKRAQENKKAKLAFA
jgi:hypothetical protein